MDCSCSSGGVNLYLICDVRDPFSDHVGAYPTPVELLCGHWFVPVEDPVSWLKMAESFMHVIRFGLAGGGLFEDLAGGCKGGNHFGPAGFHNVVIVDGAILSNVWSVVRVIAV